MFEWVMVFCWESGDGGFGLFLVGLVLGVKF